MSDELWNMELFQRQFGTGVREGIDMSESEVKKSRLSINLKMAEMNIEPKDRAFILNVLGLATPEEFRPEFRPEFPTRWCSKKLHNIGDPSTYRSRKLQNIFADDRVCLACEQDAKAKKASANG